MHILLIPVQRYKYLKAILLNLTLPIHHLILFPDLSQLLFVRNADLKRGYGNFLCTYMCVCVPLAYTFLYQEE